MTVNSINRRMWVLWSLLIFQYLFSTWLMVGAGALEGMFMKFDNAGIEGNIMIFILYLLATFSNAQAVFIFGEPEILSCSNSMDSGNDKP